MYSFSIYIISGLFRIAAFFNPKARKFVSGRKGLFSRLILAFRSASAPIAWVHCASLGEFEQGRPLIEQFRRAYPDYQILLTFFSPSGFEVRKNYAQADHIFYLPWDTAGNARKFIEITKPSIAFFIKYEFWHNFIHELYKRKIPIVSVSAIFRNDQIFFRFYGSFFRATLKKFDHLFVQNENSARLLKSIGIDKVTISGDTRFDRVKEIIDQRKEISHVKEFKGTDNIFVIGSCWPEDFELLVLHVNESRGKLKFIIAPHEIKESFLTEIEQALSVKVCRYSKIEGNTNADVLLIDNIGMLASLYQYGEFAYVGGGLGKGLHNVLEAACYGIPVFFGNRNYEKFQEAKDLIMRGGAFEVSDYADFKMKYESLINRPENYLLAADVTRSYVMENLGATKKVIDYVHTLLRKK